MAQNKNQTSSQLREKRKAKMNSCMKNAKSEKEKLRCKRIYSNIFDPISKEQKAKQDSTLKSFFKRKSSPKKKSK